MSFAGNRRKASDDDCEAEFTSITESTSTSSVLTKLHLPRHQEAAAPGRICEEIPENLDHVFASEESAAGSTTPAHIAAGMPTSGIKEKRGTYSAPTAYLAFLSKPNRAHDA